MSVRILLRVSPRQSPSSAILFEMSSDADWPWLAPDFFMFSPFHFDGGSENRTPRPWAAPEQIFDPGACGTFLHRWPPKHAYFCTDGVQPSDAQVRNLTALAPKSHAERRNCMIPARLARGRTEASSLR